MKKKNTWIAICLVGMLVIILVLASAHKTPPTIVSGTTKAGVAKLDGLDGVKVKIKVPDGKYLALTSDGEIFKVVKVKAGQYTYTDVADEDSYHIVAYATDTKPHKYGDANKVDSIGKVKFKIPVENIASSDEDDGDDDTVTSTSSSADSYSTDDDGEDDYSVSDDPATKTYRTDLTFDQLARDPDSYKGADFTMTGSVLQVLEDDDDDSVELRVAINGDYDDVILLDYDSEIMDGQRVLEDDKITFSGTSLGTTTYESTMGGDITVPAATVDKITDDGPAPEDYGY